MSNCSATAIAPTLDNALLANHLAFLAKHRGTITREPEMIKVDSDNADCTYAIVPPSADQAPRAYGKAHRLQPLHADVAAFDGWRVSGGLSYMQLTTPPCEAGPPLLTIERARDTAGIDVFSEVQARSFIAQEDAHRQWHPWLRGHNLRNVADPQQHFLVARLHGVAVGVTLLLISETAAGIRQGGIYAVGTLPAYRRRGISSILLQTAIRTARDNRCETITLQVNRGSEAERLYLKLGFEIAFQSQILERLRP